MMNNIGKGLVLVYTVGCLAGLMLALVVYFNFIDWGRAEPRILRGDSSKGPGNDMRIASEYEKGKAIFDNAVAGRNLVVAPIAPAEAALHEAQEHFAQNHLFYVAELKRLRSDEGDIEVKRLPPDGVQTDTPGKVIGKPIPSVKVPDLNKSLKQYGEILRTEQAKIKPIEDAISDPKVGLAKKNTDISFHLTGKNAEGKQTAHGLFDLVNIEFNMQQLLLDEYKRVQPYWATASEEARRYSARRVSLEATLSGLEQALKAKEAKRRTK
jgi:hypothetical protein